MKMAGIPIAPPCPFSGVVAAANVWGFAWSQGYEAALADIIVERSSDPSRCCDYRDHGDMKCACPNHPMNALHPFGRP